MLNLKGMRFSLDVILVRIPRYVAYPLSYQHQEGLMEERSVSVDRSSINRRAIRFLPLIEKLSRKHKRLAGGSWQMDEIPAPTESIFYGQIDLSTSAS